VTNEFWIELVTEFGIELCNDEYPYLLTTIEILLDIDSKALGIYGNIIYNFYMCFKWRGYFGINLNFYVFAWYPPIIALYIE
jgi:hypothetical protein